MPLKNKGGYSYSENPAYTLAGETFFQAPTLDLSQALLGCILVHDSPEGLCSGIIVETEGYLQDDPACHAYRKMTPRNAPMFGPAGTCYIYLIYGVHHCFNIVCREKGVGEAVLIRALEPLDGVELMSLRRGTTQLRDLCSGPGKLVQALGIHPGQNGHSLTDSALGVLLPKTPIPQAQIETSVRIGISKGADLPYRYFIKDNRFVSRK